MKTIQNIIIAIICLVITNYCFKGLDFIQNLAVKGGQDPALNVLFMCVDLCIVGVSGVAMILTWYFVRMFGLHYSKS